MDWNKEEIKADLDKLKFVLEAIEEKYGDTFGISLCMGVRTNDDFFCGFTALKGEDEILHTIHHNLLNNPKYIIGLFEAINCVLDHREESDFMRVMREEALNGVRDVLLKCTDAYAEMEAEKMVNELIKKEFGN